MYDMVRNSFEADLAARNFRQQALLIACKARDSMKKQVQSSTLNQLEKDGKIPSKDKFRLMPCNTFIMNGACPYHDRCVFLHDPRLRIEGVKTRPAKGSKSTLSTKDAFYWPDMDLREVSSKLDARHLPSVEQNFEINEKYGSELASRNDRACYSMWYHLSEYCSLSSRQPSKALEMEPFFTHNHHNGMPRLPCFVALANGGMISPGTKNGRCALVGKTGNSIEIKSSTVSEPTALGRVHSNIPLEQQFNAHKPRAVTAFEHLVTLSQDHQNIGGTIPSKRNDQFNEGNSRIFAEEMYSSRGLSSFITRESSPTTSVSSNSSDRPTPFNRSNHRSAQFETKNTVLNKKDGVMDHFSYQPYYSNNQLKGVSGADNFKTLVDLPYYTSHEKQLKQFSKNRPGVSSQFNSPHLYSWKGSAIDAAGDSDALSSSLTDPDAVSPYTCASWESNCDLTFEPL